MPMALCGREHSISHVLLNGAHTIAQSAIACNGGNATAITATGGGCVSLYFDGVTNAGIFTHAAGTNLAYSELVTITVLL
jgi:hypothetical protein